MPPPRRPQALRGRVFRGRDVLDDGLLTPNALRSSAWRRLFRDVYADAALPFSFDLKVAGAALLMPAQAVFSGRTAAHLHGAGSLVDPRSLVDVSVPSGVRFGPVSGLAIRRVALPPSDVTILRRRRRCTTGLRTALDIARTEQLPESVVALDVLLAGGIADERELREAVVDLAGRRGARRAQQAVGLADPRAESPPESRVRVLLALAGLVAEPQFTVRDAHGAFVARVDLAFPELRVAIEYDGSWHGQAGQLGRDRRRHNRLTQERWRVLYLTAAEMRDPAAVVVAVRRLLATASAGK